jgi:hypothetical protein
MSQLQKFLLLEKSKSTTLKGLVLLAKGCHHQRHLEAAGGDGHPVYARLIHGQSAYDQQRQEKVVGLKKVKVMIRFWSDPRKEDLAHRGK